MNNDIVFNFDTTGSMYPCLNEVRKKLADVLTLLFAEIPNLRVGLGASGDYCDGVNVLNWMDLTSNITKLHNFVKTAPKTNGGDLPEAYELVLHKASGLGWSENANSRIFVLIADDVPHTPTYFDNKLKLDWRREAIVLRDMGVTIYTIQCLGKKYATDFYKELSAIGGGYYLELDQFSDILQLLLAIIYKQQGPEALATFEKKVIADNKMNRALDKSFGVLTGQPRDNNGRWTTVSKMAIGGLTPVPNGRFQVMDVSYRCAIQQFVEDNSLTFELGRGFYEFMKKEYIQDHKEIVVRDIKTGDIFSGPDVRRVIGIPTFGITSDGIVKNAKTPRKIDPTSFPGFEIFVQSQSNNRILLPGTKFLYEVDLSK